MPTFLLIIYSLNVVAPEILHAYVTDTCSFIDKMSVFCPRLCDTSPELPEAQIVNHGPKSQGRRCREDVPKGTALQTDEEVSRIQGKQTSNLGQKTSSVLLYCALINT